MLLEIIIIVLLAALVFAVWFIGRRLTQSPPPDPRLDEVLDRLGKHHEAIERLGGLPDGLDDVRTRLVAGGEQQKNLR